MIRKFYYILLILPLLAIYGCKDDDAKLLSGDQNLTGESKQYQLREVAGSKVNGNVTFLKRKDNSTAIIIRLQGTPAGGSHPAHIHFNSAAEGGNIALDLNNVDGSSGYSETIVSKLNDGTAISFEQLKEYNGYINVHESAANLGKLVAQGDIGINELTSTSKTYKLDSLGAQGLEGTATFTKRVNGKTLVRLAIENTAETASHPAHIHANSAAEGGGIVISLKNVDGATGISQTDVKKLDSGAEISYDELMDFNGYINVHKSADDLANVVSQGDIGGNELLSDTKTYNLLTKAVAGISGKAIFTKRKNGKTLVTLDLDGTPAGGIHPAHIHFNSAAEGGGIAIDLKSVDGTTGMSKTTIRAVNGPDGPNTGTPISYDSLMNFDGYVNVHLSPANLATIVAQGDIGGNELTGNSKEYILNPVTVPSIAGTARLEERKNGNTLVTLKLSTPAGGLHPAHIHANSAAEGGGIVISLRDVDGNTGLSVTNVRTLNAGGKITYEDLLDYDGYINVHESAANLATLVAQGDIGGNELTGNSKVYPLLQKDVAGIYGNAKFEERKNGNTLITLTLSGTPAGGVHPAHIHQNSAAEGGPIVVSLKDVNGTTGKSLTNVEKFDGAEGAAVTYTQLTAYDGYINVHKSAAELGILVAQGNIGSNAP